MKLHFLSIISAKFNIIKNCPEAILLFGPTSGRIFDEEYCSIEFY